MSHAVLRWAVDVLVVPPASVFDFREPLPLPAAAAPLSTALTESAPRVGLLLGMASGRAITASCAGLRRVALVEVTSADSVWAPLRTGLPDAALLVADPASTIALADVFLGGNGTPEQRSVTPLELTLLVRQVVPSLRPLAEALADHGVTSFEAGPATIEPLPTGYGEVVAVPLQLDLPSGATASLTLCLPAKTLLPSDTGPVVPEPTPAAADALSDVPVEVTVRMLPSYVPAAEVDTLQPGDVVALAPDAALQLVGLLPGDLPLFAAELGRRDDRRAVLVHSLETGAR